jgi:hypothetical protein
MLLICLLFISPYLTKGQSKVKLIVNIEKDVYKTVTNKKEIEKMGAGGVFEKLVKKQNMQLGSSLNVDRERFLNATISGDNETLSFEIIEKSSRKRILHLDSLVINGKYEISGSTLNDAISNHIYDSGNCTTWEQEYSCDLIMLIYRNKKVILKKTFNIYPIIG